MKLFIIAWVLMLPLTLINYLLVKEKKGYFRSTALNIDIWANKEYRTLWNKMLIVEKGYKFGKDAETISSALGKNERDETLTTTGKYLVKILNKIDENHCKNSINEEIS